MDNRFRNRVRDYYPAYISKTIGPLQRWLLERWFARDARSRAEMENLISLDSALKEQRHVFPEPSLLSRIMTQIPSQTVGKARVRRPSLVWVPLFGLLFLAGVLLWRALPPGLVVQWSVEGETPSSFRIYRAPVDRRNEVASQEDFTLLSVIPAEGGMKVYGYTDLRLVPGQQYLYRVEAVDRFGQSIASQPMLGNALEALPGQLSLLLLFVVTGFGLLTAIRQVRMAGRNERRLAT